MATKEQILEKIDRIEKKALGAVRDSFPLDTGTYIVEVENLQVIRPPLFDLNYEIDLKDKEANLRGSIKGILVVKDKETGKVISRSMNRDLVFIPYLTNRGTYIVGGMEKVIAKQMRLKPGVYTYDKDSKVESLIFLQKGKNIYLNFDPESLNLTIRLEGRHINAITFFRILGISDSEIAQAVDDPKIAEQLFRKAQSKQIDTETQKLWSRLPAISKSSSSYPGRRRATEDIQRYFFSMSEFGETGSKVMQTTLGYFSNSPDKQVFLLTLSKIIRIAKADTEDKKIELSDDRDDIRFQDVLADEDQIEYFVRKGLEEITSEISQRIRNSPDRDVLTLYTASKTSVPINSFMSRGHYSGTGSLVDLVEQTNPLLMSSAHRKITSLGEGGLTTESAAQGTRNLQNSTFGKLDPVETPESGKIGLVSHLTRNSYVSNLTIKSKYYKVSNGSFTKKDSNIVELEPLEEHDKYIAFFDPNVFKSVGTKIEFPQEVWVRHQGTMIKVPRNKVDLVDISPHAIWGDATSLIPFSAHNDGNRMLMGSNMQKQALIITNREAPLVQNATDPSKKTTYEEVIAKEQAFLVESDVEGVVDKVTDEQIVIRDAKGKTHTHDLMNYFPLNMSHYIKNDPVVKPGDKVSKGQLLAEGWQTKDGKLALGVNARVAYMPWKGYNFEDGYVISESFAKKMTTEELKEISVDIASEQVGGPGSDVKSILAQLNVPRSELDKLDENGIIKVGEEVGPNTILVGIVEEDTSLDDLPEYKVLRMLGTKIQRQYDNKSEVITGYISGKVIRVKVIPRGAGAYNVKITVLMRNPLKEGDKLAGRHGNKGIITRIERDADMPVAEDGESIDIIYSPLGVPSRKNLGQLYEANAGLIASKKGTPFKVFNFDKSEADEVKKGLEEIGFPDGKMTLFDPETGKPYENKTTVGVSYMMKLHHKVDEKLQARNIGKVNYLYNSPAKSIGVRAGEKKNPQKFGEMEMRALEAAKAVHFIDESTHLRSDGAGDDRKRESIFDALAFGGLNSIKRTAPTSLHIFKDYTSAMGLNVKPMYNTRELKSLDDNFNSLAIAPYKPEVIKKFSRGEVTESKLKSSYIRGDKPDKGGLLDPDIFGETREEQRNYWGHIDLGMPLPNPVLLTSNVNPYSALLGINKSRIETILTDKVGVITNPGDTGLGKSEVVPLEKIVELEEKGANFDYELGGKALEQMLKEINIDEELKRTQEDLVAAKPRDRAQYYKKLRALRMLKDNDMRPEDLMIKTLPVLPAGLRPFVKTEDNRQIVDDMNYLYKNFIQVNNKIKDISDPQSWYVTDPTTKYELSKDAYRRLEAIMGTNTRPVTIIGNKEAEGIMSKMKEKDGLIRGRLMSKFNDYSGRSVITVNPSLSLDEAGVPVDMAATLYQPFVMRELFITQKAKNAEQALEKSSDPNDPDTVAALEKVIAQRPVVLNRQPSLHKYSIQAFTPKLTKARAIELNPLVVKGFNADFDGDSFCGNVRIKLNLVNNKTEMAYNEDTDKLLRRIKNYMPFNENIRYINGLINLRDFPRGDLIEKKGNKEVYSVPGCIEVLTARDGEITWLPVESYSIHKNLDIVEITTNTSRTIQCSTDHSLVTVDDSLNYIDCPPKVNITIPRLRDIISDDNYKLIHEITLPDKQESKYTLESNNVKLDFNFGYFNGVYIGDGWASGNDDINAVCLASDKDFIPNRIIAIINNYFTKDVHMSKVASPHEFKGCDSYSAKHTWHSRTFSSYLRDNIGQGAENKHLPLFWMHSPADFRWGMLSGLIDTDGSVSVTSAKRSVPQWNINYTTTSRGLAYEIVGLAHSLDLTASVTITQTPAGRECCVVTFTQDSIEKMQACLSLASPNKAKVLSEFVPNESYKRNKYTPKLSRNRLKELRQLIGSPRTKSEYSDEENAAIKKRKSLYSIVYRVEKDGTAITKDTALKILNLNLAIFEQNDFWAKWKEMVLDDSIEWELVTNIRALPFITEAYDLTIPPAYTMVTESGLIVYDTMSVHVPLTSEATQEAKTLLTPSQNLINPTNGSLITPIQGEAILGIYYLTIDKNKGKTPKKDVGSYDQLMSEYKSGELSTYDIVTFNGVTSTVGKHLVNDILPVEYRDYNRVINGKELSSMIEKMINEEDDNKKNKTGPQTAVVVLNRLKDLGFLASTKSALSISVFDLKENKDKDKLIQEAEERVRKNPNELVSVYYDVDDALQSKIEGTLGPNNPMTMFMASGAKGKKEQTSRMINMVGLSQDITGTIRKEMAIKSSFKEGLSPQEMWIHAYDSRRGLADRALSTSEPGALTRRIWNSTQDAIISVADCGDVQGMYLNVKDASLVGRFLAQVVRDGDGNIVLPYNKLIDIAEKDKLQKLPGLEGVYVRSPLTCKAVNGICQKCYGTLPGTSKMPIIGEPVGIIASQAIGEPTAQGVMKTFHGGGAQRPGSTSGFARVNEIFNVSSSPKNASVLSPVDGRVLGVAKEITSTVIILEYEENGRRRTKNITVPLTKVVLVKAGDRVVKGGRLTEAEGALNPREILEYKGISETQNYLVSELASALEDNNINRKHMELAIGKLTDKVEIEDNSVSGWLPGQIVPRNQVDRWNELNAGTKQKIDINDIVKLVGARAAKTYKGFGGEIIVSEGEEITKETVGKLMALRTKKVEVYPGKIAYNPVIFGVIPNPTKGNDNWFSQMGHQNIKEPLAEGAAFGKTDLLSDPRGRQMAGKLINVGSGYNRWKEEFQKLKDKVGGTIAGLFD